jgi:signal transduction histidine kinase
MRLSPSRFTQIDWLLSTLRWLLLFAVLIVVLLTPAATQRPLLLLIGGAVYNLAVMILLVFEVRPPLLPWISIILDTALAIGLIAVSGGAASPLLFAGLFPILSAALRFDWPVAVLSTGSIVAAYYLLGGTLPEIMTLVLTAIVASALGYQIRGLVAEAKRSEEDSELRKLRSTREQAQAIFEMASTLSATLNYQRILDAVLDVSALGLKEIGPASTRMIGVVLLFTSAGLKVAASRHLNSRDEKLLVDLKEGGSVSQSLAKAEPVICDDPIHDPELTTFTAMHRCQIAVCVPLRAGFENFGAAVFGSQDAGVFTPDNIDLLTAVCNQAIIALQNAQLFESLRSEKARIVEIEEDARKKLARDLHDGPTQNVAAIAMRLNYTRTLFQRDRVRVPEELEKLEELARNTTKEIRHMLFTLRPLVLETQGLKAALETLVQKLHETDPDLQVHLELDDLAEKLDKDIQGMMFYVVEEAVGNARKHAEAHNVWIRTTPNGRDYLIEVQDDGKGFDVGKVQANYDQRGSLGMINMHERAEVLNAKLSIASAIGQGTRVTMRLPLERVQK